MTMYNKIMVPYDGSEHAKNALKYAQGLAQADDSVTICLVHVMSQGSLGYNQTIMEGAVNGVPLFMLDNEQYREIVESAFNDVKAKVIESLSEELEGWQGRLTVDVVAGSSAVDALAKFAHDNKADLVVMGRRGLGAVRGLLGSVSFGVLRAVDCPVLTVK